jgi:hypothetical protein
MATPEAATNQVSETAQFHENMLAMNEALMVGSVRQHELTEATNLCNARLQAEIIERTQAEAALRAARLELAQANAELEQKVRDRTARFEESAFAECTVHRLCSCRLQCDCLSQNSPKAMAKALTSLD